MSSLLGQSLLPLGSHSSPLPVYPAQRPCHRASSQHSASPWTWAAHATQARLVSGCHTPALLAHRCPCQHRQPAHVFSDAYTVSSCASLLRAAACSQVQNIISYHITRIVSYRIVSYHIISYPAGAPPGVGNPLASTVRAPNHITAHRSTPKSSAPEAQFSSPRGCQAER